MNTSTIKVLIVDDHQIVRDGLNLMLTVNPGLACTGQAENGEQAVRLCAELKPDVVLMDLMMPLLDGVSAIQSIHQQFPEIKIVALTSFSDKDLVKRALRAGATGYVLKNASMESIVASIREAYLGRPSLSPAVMEVLSDIEEEQPIPGQVLTDREYEILLLMADGLTNAAIAKKLYISEATARFHVSNILRKLQAANRAQAVHIAVEQGILQRGSPPADRFSKKS